MFFLRIVLLLEGLLLASSAAFSADYAAGYSVGADYRYYDNINGASDNNGSGEGPISANAEIGTTNFNLSRNSENYELKANLGLDFYNYDIDGYNTQNQNFDIANKYVTELNTFTFGGGTNRASTNTSQQFQEQSGVTTINSAERYTTNTWQAGWEHQLTEVNRFNLSMNNSDINYTTDQYVGSRSASYTSSISQILNDTLYVFVQVNHDINDSDRAETFPGLASSQQHSETNGLALGANYQFYEEWLITGYAGQSQVKTKPNLEDISGYCDTIYADFFPQCGLIDQQKTTKSNTAYADIKTEWSGEAAKISAGFNRSQQPDSNGELLNYDRWSANGSYRWDELNSINVDVVYRLSSGVIQIPGEDPGDRKYWDTGIGWTRQLTETWSLNNRVSYYREIEPTRSTNSELKTNSWQYTLGIRYTPPLFHWSR
jgi:hypothetical protein